MRLSTFVYIPSAININIYTQFVFFSLRGRNRTESCLLRLLGLKNRRKNLLGLYLLCIFFLIFSSSRPPQLTAWIAGEGCCTADTAGAATGVESLGDIGRSSS